MTAIYNYFFGRPKTRSVPIDNIEDDWVDVAPQSQAIVLYIFQQSAYTVEEPNDDAPAIALTHAVSPFSSPLIEEIDESSQPSGPIVEDIDSNAILATPQKHGIPAPILTVAIATGAAAQTAGIGAVVLETAVGTYFMSTMVNPTSWAVTQYLAGRAAQAAAASFLSTPILGVSLPVIANVGFAIGAAVGVAHLGIFLYNRVSSNNRIEHSGTTSIVASRFLGIDQQNNKQRN